ncbi:MAG: sulfate adenylyltransferase [Actinobacteria bacterium]|nr:MAG: sulfate adenylyltransferase [Actinomycetota bacterium]
MRADLLRFTTAGSVDDGKSTLIGRLLYDAKSLFEDQIEAVERTSVQWGFDYVNLALLTDGLRAEREQGITIDVAYRYFATPRRKFIIADTPGHVQYTRNMVTGASTADLALILVDARKGLTEQSRRHAVVANLLHIPHLVVCINKMDLVDWDQGAFEAIKDDFRAFASRFDVTDIVFILGWYQGTPLLHHLEEVHIASDRNLVDVRFPVQYVIRPHNDAHHDYRGYAGQLAAGVLRVGDEIVVQPSGLASKVAAIDTYDGPVVEAYPPMSVTVRLEDDIDVSRGDLLCRPHNQPTVGQDIEAMVCWLTDRPLQPNGRYALKHTTRSARAVVKELRYRLDINTLHRDEDCVSLALNEMGRLHLRVTAPLMFDDYRRDRATGSFILVDEATNATAGAGMILGPA